MSQAPVDPHVLFGSLDFDFDDVTDDRPTWPAPGSAQLTIIDKFEPLFTSATWTIVATIGTDVIARSKEADKPHTGPFIKRWSRQLIRTRYELLRRRGVDADAEYARLGGDLNDLLPLP